LDCGTKYEHYFKTKEVKDELHCPKCNSNNSEKLITAANIGSISSSFSMPTDASCPTCQCPGGACGLN